MPLELKTLQVKIHVLLGPANSVAVRCRQLEQFFESQNKGKFIILLETATEQKRSKWAKIVGCKWEVVYHPLISICGNGLEI